MTDHAEEQEMEAEALKAIFDEHFSIVSPDQWTIDLYPELEEADNNVACRVCITLPPTYPEVVPEFRIELVKGLAEEHEHMLQRMAEEEAEANLGVPSLFAVAERLREWLLENNVTGLDDVSMHAQMMRKKVQEEKDQLKTVYESQAVSQEMSLAEQEEVMVRKQRAEGTPCTRENFEAWQARFLAEIETNKAENDTDETQTKRTKEKVVDKTGRLTGYQQFINKMGNFEALEAAAEEVEEQEYDEELFEDDVDVDDLDFSDDEDEEQDDEALDI